MSPPPCTPAVLLDFWFSEPARSHWFASTEALDSEIRARFEDCWQAGARGELADWDQAPDSALALVILLDQLPLNMFRGQPQAFATEAASRAVAATAIARGWDRALPDERRLFLYLPYMHSEDLADQARCVALLAAAGMETRWAEHHRDIVRRFGRFPHRNAVLGRTSTAEEQAWLDSPEAFRG